MVVGGLSAMVVLWMCYNIVVRIVSKTHKRPHHPRAIDAEPC